MYGCGRVGPAAAAHAAPDPSTLPAPASPGPPSPTGRRDVSDLRAFAFLMGGGLWLLAIALLAWAPVAAYGVFFAGPVLFRAVNDAFPADGRALPGAAEDPIALETKAVLAHLGQGTPGELAHAYALFEQRHPKARLPAEAMGVLARELLDGGYRVLAAEVLEKAMGRDPDPKLGELARHVFLADPAFWEEAAPLVGGKPDPASLDVASLLEPAATYLVAHAPSGFPLSHQRPHRLPLDPTGEEPARTRRIAGPLDPGVRDAWLAELRAAGHLVLPVLPGEITLPPARAARELAFTSKGARFVTEAGAEEFGWEEVHTFFYERLEKQVSEQVTRTHEVPNNLHRGSCQNKGVITSSDLEVRIEYVSILEVHAGDPARRYRVAEATPDLFHYLGRRRGYAYEPNLRLVAKDLARFAPHARASRGAVALFSERQGREVPLSDLREFEELAAWFTALGSPRIRAWWRAAYAP